MPVSDEDGPDPVRLLQQVGNVGDNEVYPRHALLRKLDTTVHDDDVIAALHGHHILADLSQPAQRDDAHRWFQFNYIP